MSLTLLLWIVCAVFSLGTIALIVTTKAAWEPPSGRLPPKISAARAEKSCDAVLGVLALLIPATLGLLTWLREKMATGSYLIPLGFALAFFFALLTFTVYMRFNLLWRYDRAFVAGPGHEMSFPYWLTTVMCCLVFGLVLLAIPVLELAAGYLNPKDPSPQPALKVDCNCKLPQPTVQVVMPPAATATQHHRKRHYRCTQKPLPPQQK